MLKNVTLKTLAKELGMSLSGVSKALNDYPDINEETKKLVIDKAIELGYTPNLNARNLAKNTSNLIGIVVRDISTIYGELFKPLSLAADRYGMKLMLADSNRSREMELNHVKSMLESRVVGMIIAPVSGDISEIKKLIRFRIPVVYLGGRIRDNSENYVSSDNRYGTNLGMDYLFGLGHRDIAFISDRNQSNSTQIKVEVYKARMEEMGLEPAVFMDDSQRQDLTTAGRRQAVRMLESGRRFSAVFASKDMVALGVMKELQDNGLRIPEDISVLGFDGAEASSLPLVDLTTIAQPKEELAESLVKMIISQSEVGHEIVPKHFLAKPTLVERRSCRSI